MSKVERELERAMTVADLIEELRSLPKDAKVFFTCDYGDHCHTIQALPVKSIDEHTAKTLSESAYSQSGIEFNDGNDDDDETFYCENCDKEVGHYHVCPKCKQVTVREDGTPADEDCDDETPIVILGHQGY